MIYLQAILIPGISEKPNPIQLFFIPDTFRTFFNKIKRIIRNANVKYL